MFQISLAVALGLFGTVFFAGWLLTALRSRYRTQLEARLRDLAGDESPKTSRAKRAPAEIERGVARRSVDSPVKLSRLISDSDDDRKRHQARLVQAGIYHPTALATFFFVKLSLVVMPPMLGLLAGWAGVIAVRRGLMWGCAAALFGIIVPSLWLERRIRYRHCALRRSLADFLDLMIVCLESGLSLQGTIQRVTDELRIAHPELAGELNIVQRDMNLGTTVDAALRRFALRSGYEGIRSLATFVREAQRFGTQLTQALRLHADMLRSQRENAAEEMAQKAAVKILIPTLLLILPAVFVVLAGPAAIQIQQAFAK
jgi:tight adherence protein C